MQSDPGSGHRSGFVAGFLAAALLFGVAGAAAHGHGRDIRIYDLPLRYFVDGVQQVPPAGQEGFIYNDRTYVPLRFLSEALGKQVEWDGSTYSVYLGRRPAAVPPLWSFYRTEGPGTVTVQQFDRGLLDTTGEEYPNTMLVTARAPLPDAGAAVHHPTQISWEFTTDWEYSSLTGQVVIPEEYRTHRSTHEIGRLVILNEMNMQVFSAEFSSSQQSVPIDLSLRPYRKVRILLLLYPEQGPREGTDGVAMVGLSNWQMNRLR